MARDTPKLWQHPKRQKTKYSHFSLSAPESHRRLTKKQIPKLYITTSNKESERSLENYSCRQGDRRDLLG